MEMQRFCVIRGPLSDTALSVPPAGIGQAYFRFFQSPEI